MVGISQWEMEAHCAQKIPGCPRTDGRRSTSVHNCRLCALATIISRILVNAVTQILPVADENNNTRSSYRAARLRCTNALHLLHYVAAKKQCYHPLTSHQPWEGLTSNTRENQCNFYCVGWCG